MFEKFKKQTNKSQQPLPYKKYENSAVVDSIINQAPSDTDPNGSYTGKPIDQNEVPVQDADDL